MKHTVTKRNVWTLLLAALMLLAVLAVPMRAQADQVQVPAISTANFELSYVNSSYTQVGISLVLPSGGWYAQTQVLYNGQVVGSYDNGISYASFSVPMKRNRVYEYRIRLWKRQYDSTIRDYVYTYGDWTPCRAFSTVNPKVSLVSSKSKTVKFKIPKVAGAKKMILYMSTSSSSGFKKVATIKPGKSKNLSKFRGKTFPYYKTYYYRIVTKLKDGRTCDGYLNGNFWIRRIWK